MKSYFDIWKLQVTSEQIKEQHSKKVSDLHRKTDGIHKIIDGTTDSSYLQNMLIEYAESAGEYEYLYTCDECGDSVCEWTLEI